MNFQTHLIPPLKRILNSINFTKSKGILQPMLASFGQFTIINFFRLFDYKQHFLEFVSILTRKVQFENG